MLDSERGWRLQEDACRDLIARLPSDVVLSWVRRHGLPAARAIARHLPAPRIDDAGKPVVPEVLDTVLREYDDEQVFESFTAGMHSGEIWGENRGDSLRREAEAAKRFLSHPNPRIRQWAQQEIPSRLRWAEYEDREHEERFLPS